MRPLDPVKENKIIGAVFVICGKEGLSGVNIAAISKEAGIGVGSLYTYFDSKEDLIETAYNSVEHRLTRKMYEGYDPEKPLRDSFHRIFLNSINYRINHFSETVFIDQYIQSSYVQYHLDKQMSEYRRQHKPLYELIAKGQKQGLINRMDVFAISNFFNGAARSCSNGMVQKLIPMKKQVIDKYFEMVWNGLST